MQWSKHTFYLFSLFQITLLLLRNHFLGAISQPNRVISVLPFFFHPIRQAGYRYLNLSVRLGGAEICLPWPLRQHKSERLHGGFYLPVSRAAFASQIIKEEICFIPNWDTSFTKKKGGKVLKFSECFSSDLSVEGMLQRETCRTSPHPNVFICSSEASHLPADATAAPTHRAADRHSSDRGDGGSLCLEGRLSSRRHPSDLEPWLTGGGLAVSWYRRATKPARQTVTSSRPDVTGSAALRQTHTCTPALPVLCAAVSVLTSQTAN